MIGWSGHFAVVVLQKAAKPFATFHLAGDRADLITRGEDFVAQSLMVSFSMIMNEKRKDGSTK